MKHLPRLASRVFNTPLAIAPDKAAVVAAVLSAKLAGDSLAASADDGGESEPVELEISSNGIAQLSICGTLVERSSWLDAYCGMVSYDAIAQQLAAAESDARVRGILLVIDSPGGEVSGMFECARALAAVTKPMYAVVNYCACSAAYLLAAQADMIFVTESSLAGSIGVIAQHMETSAWDAEAGIKYTTIFAGARKNDGNPHEPLSDGAREAIQADVDDVMQKFVTSVAQARGVPEEEIRATEAGIFRGEHVIAAGLADEVGSPADALALLGERINTGSVAAATRLKKEVLTMSTTVADPKLAAKQGTAEESTEDQKPKVDDPKAEKPIGTEEVPEPEKKKEDGPEAHTLEVVTLCEIAGKTNLIGKFIRERTPLAKVREFLLDAKAGESESIHSAIDPSVGARKAAINLNDPKENPLLADAQRRRAAAEGKKGA